MKKIRNMIAVLTLGAALTGCASAQPSQVHATMPPPEVSSGFESADGSVSFQFETTLTGSAGPRVEVVPMELTGADVRRVAQAVLGQDAVFTALRPGADDWEEPLTKAELQERIDRYTPFTDPQRFQDLFGSDRAEQTEGLERLLEEYTGQLADAPETIEDRPCDFTFELGRWLCDTISCRADANGITYRFEARVDEQLVSGYRPIWISLYPAAETGPMNIDRMLLNTQVLTGPAPSQAGLDNMRLKAEQILKAMELGDWEVRGVQSRSWNQESRTFTEIILTAVPVLEGQAALTNLAVRSGNPPKAELVFTPGGEVYSFHLTWPVTVARTGNEQTVPAETLLQTARDELRQLCVKDFMSVYDWPYADKMTAQVHVTQLRFGLARVESPDVKTYPYVPVLEVCGTAEFYDGDTGNWLGSIRYSPPDLPDGTVRLLVLSALDGSVLYKLSS